MKSVFLVHDEAFGSTRQGMKSHTVRYDLFSLCWRSHYNDEFY